MEVGAAATAGPAVVVGYDGSAAAAAAVGWACRYAHLTAADVEIVVAWTWDMWGGYPPEPDLSPETEAHGRAAAAVAIASGAGLVRARAVRGTPAVQLVAASRRALLLVIGASRRSSRPAPPQTVAARCVRDATCPVVVVPAPAEDVAVWSDVPLRSDVTTTSSI